MLASVENRLQITLDGLTADEVASLAAALRTESLDEKAIQGCTGVPAGIRCTCARS